MSSVTVRLSDSLHSQLRAVAKKDKVSINQLINAAVAEKVSALMTEDYLEARAARGSREAFERAMMQVPHVAPEPYDAL
jgi:predicted transcriptional regulator